MSDAPITPRRINGHPCILAPAATIRAALNGAQPLTITSGHAAGEQVWLAPLTRPVWDDDSIAIHTEHIADDTITHPEHGQILAAYIDTTRLGPVMARLENERKAKIRAGYHAQQARVAAMVPSCDNCGNCKECC